MGGMIKAFTRAALLVAGLLALPASASADRRVIVRYEQGATASERMQVRAATDVRLMHRLKSFPNVDVVSASAAEIARLRGNPEVAFVELDGIASLPEPSSGAVREDSVGPFSSEPFAGLLWGQENTGQTVNSVTGTVDADIDAPAAWARTSGAGVTVAVVDTGVDYTHPDLAANIVAGYDFVDLDYDAQDEHYHGTHVAGTIAAIGDNSAGVVGVAPQARIMPLRVLDADALGYMSDIADAFAYAGDHGASVVNASLGGSNPSTLIEQAVKAHPKTLYVVAAGNDGTNNDSWPTYPCNSAAANLICVAASDPYDQRAGFSNYGRTSVDVAAPGTDIASTLSIQSGYHCTIAPFDIGYCFLDGTSMAAPHVAGVAALVSAQGATAVAVKNAIMSTVDVKPAWTGLLVSGGRVNADAATTPPTPPATPPAPPAPAPALTSPTPTMVSLSRGRLTVRHSLRLSFTVDKVAHVTLGFRQRQCRTRKRRKVCSYVVRRTESFSVPAGANARTLARRRWARTLPSGTYVLDVKATNAAGSRVVGVALRVA